jgi:Protein of unknown function (DUF3662)/FHA domain
LAVVRHSTQAVLGTLARVVLQAFERRLERLVEGAFGRAFRSGVQPVEIGRRMVRELEAHREIGVRGTVAPNQYTVALAPDDDERFAPHRAALVRELEESVRDYARSERYHFLGPVAVELVADVANRRGEFTVAAAIVPGADGWRAALVLPDGSRVALTDDATIIGRLPDCAVRLSDPQSSRHHAEVRAGHDAYRLRDLGSTNGTYLNGVAVSEHPLRDGDEIRIGSTVLRFEES